MPQCLHMIKLCRTLRFYVLELQYKSTVYLIMCYHTIYSFLFFPLYIFLYEQMGEKRSAGLESRVFFTWPHICFEVQARDLLLQSFFFFFGLINL